MTDYVYTSGGFPSSPSSGDSLVINGLFYDWTGTAWKVRSVTSKRVEFTATANQATKTGLTYFVGSIDCYINGAKMLLGSDFTATNGTSVTFTPALDLDDEVQLILGSNASFSGTTTGTTLPDPVTAAGSLFFKTDTTDLYVSNGTAWEQVTSTVLSSTGGTVTTTATHKIHTFTSSGSINVSGSVVADILIVAGGGSGGAAGGGGAGGMLVSTATLANTNYTITVGAGAAAAVGTNASGIDGASSSIGSLSTAIGGGGGGAYWSTSNAPATIGRSGGSGGGGGWPAGVGGSGTSGQGNAGGTTTDTTANPWTAAGGGGKGGQGLADSANSGGNGGIGLINTWLGSSYYFAGGGGGGAQSGTKGGDGGLGGGGGGAFANSGAASSGGGSALNSGGAGTDRLGGSGGANTGGGGGGMAVTLDTSGAGGSGIVIIRYAF